MTLYRHFENKEAILKYLLDKMMNIVIQEVYSKKNPTIADLIFMRFELLKQSPYIYAFMNNDHTFMLLENFKLHNLNYFKNLFPNTDDDYTFNFRMGGIDYVTKRWFDQGMKESSQEMTKKL